MCKEQQLSDLKKSLSDQKVNYENLKLAAFKAWDAADWEALKTSAANLQYLDESIKEKIYEIHKIEQAQEREVVELIS